MVNLERPKFLSSLLKSLAKSAEKRNWRAIVPTWIMVFAAAGAAACHFIPETFYDHDSLEISAVVYTAVLTLNGLILALSWSAFARIHDCIGSSGFCSYLMKNDLLNDYILYIDYAHLAQLVAVAASAIGLLLLLMDFTTPRYNEVAFAFMIAASGYAIKEAASSVTVMHDLIWQKAIYDDHQRKNSDKNGGGNVHSIR